MLMQVSIHRAVSRCLRKQYMAAKVVKNAYFYKQKQFRQEFSYNTYSEVLEMPCYLTQNWSTHCQ